MRKRAKRSRARREEVPTLRTLSPQLNFLLSLELDTVHELARAAHDERQTQRDKIEDLLAQARAEEDSERRLEKAEDIRKLIQGIGVPLVHGVYFPSDDKLKGDAPVALKEPYVSAFIESQCASADFGALGIQVRQQAGDVFTAFVPWDQLQRLAVMPGIDFVELARPMRPTLNTALPYSQIYNLQAAGHTGAGVIVGVLDDFLCFYHPGFRKDNTGGGDHKGSTRVLSIWDQSLDKTDQDAKPGESGPTGIPGFTATYGVEFKQSAIKAELDNFKPALANAYEKVRHEATLAGSHGTHVCGIAAGNGRGGLIATQVGPYVGAAPDADIIFVRDIVKNAWHADTTTVADAFAYVFMRATALGQPCVVNMSQSCNVGPHDGTSMIERFLDKLLLTPGRAITVAAGNATDEAEHKSGSIDQGPTTYVTLRFRSNPQNDESAEIWYSGQDVVNVTLQIPNGPLIGPIALGAYSPPVTLANGVIVGVVHTKDPHNNDNVISLFITNVDATHTIPNGPWDFGLKGISVINGAFDAWVDDNNRHRHKWDLPDDTSKTIGVPATGRRVIAVGAHDRTAPKPTIYQWSGVGPSRDNRVKPDITAVGVSVMSTWVQTVNTPSSLGSPYQTTGGTSMAAPMVAGTAALLFQCRGGSLTASDVKQLLQDTAGTNVGVPSKPFGWGYLQAANVCARPVPAVDVWIRGANADTGVEPFIGVSNLSPDIEVLDLFGKLVSNPTHDPANFINNFVRVTVRNRGTQMARNVEVYLYWSDPATYIPIGEWRATGIYTDDPNVAGDVYVVQSNKIVVPELLSGASKQVLFGWAPAAPGSNVLGDDHFCLIARVEHEDDPSNALNGGWLEVAGSNNIAARNTYVQVPTAGATGKVLFVTGSGDDDALEVETEKFDGRYELVLPVLALPWRDLELLNRTGPRRAFGADRREDLLAVERDGETIEAKEAARKTGIDGLAELRFAGGNVHLVADKANRLRIPEIRVEAGVKMPVRLLVRSAKIGRSSAFVHVRQRSGGKIVGGVTLKLTKKLVRAKRRPVRLEGGVLVPPL